jgi:hypothetical protein
VLLCWVLHYSSTEYLLVWLSIFCYSECHYTESCFFLLLCWTSFTWVLFFLNVVLAPLCWVLLFLNAMMSIIFLSDVVLSGIMLRVIMLNFFLLSVVILMVWRPFSISSMKTDLFLELKYKFLSWNRDFFSLQPTNFCSSVWPCVHLSVCISLCLLIWSVCLLLI